MFSFLVFLNIHSAVGVRCAIGFGDFNAIVEEFDQVNSSLSQELQDKAKLTLADKDFLDRVSQSNIKSDSKPTIRHIVTMSRAYQSDVGELCNVVRKKVTYSVALKRYYKKEDRRLIYDLINNYIYDTMPRIYSVVITTRYRGKSYDSELIRELKHYKSASYCCTFWSLVL